MRRRMAKEVYIAAVGLTKVDLTGRIFASIFDLFAEAYRKAVSEDPTFVEARENLALAEHIVVYINRARLQSDTGDESELSADGFKFDNTFNEGVEIVINDESRLDAGAEAQWMRTVDTAPAEFLRIKFALEAERSRRQAP